VGSGRLRSLVRVGCSSCRTVAGQGRSHDVAKDGNWNIRQVGGCVGGTRGVMGMNFQKKHSSRIRRVSRSARGYIRDRRRRMLDAPSLSCRQFSVSVGRCRPWSWSFVRLSQVPDRKQVNHEDAPVDPLRGRALLFDLRPVSTGRSPRSTATRRYDHPQSQRIDGIDHTFTTRIGTITQRTNLELSQ
jgi:hypothetical protein